MKFGLKVILLGKLPYGGAWQKTNQDSIDPRIPISTHILMHSDGLHKLLSEIQYKAVPWQLEPLEIDEKGTVIGNFAVSDNGSSIGNVSGKTDLLEFLTTRLIAKKISAFKANGQIRLQLAAQSISYVLTARDYQVTVLSSARA